MKIAAALEDLNTKYTKIEEGVLRVGSEKSWGTKSRSSFRRSLRPSRYSSNVNQSLSSVPSDDDCEENGTVSR